MPQRLFLNLPLYYTLCLINKQTEYNYRVQYGSQLNLFVQKNYLLLVVDIFPFYFKDIKLQFDESEPLPFCIETIINPADAQLIATGTIGWTVATYGLFIPAVG